VNPHREVGDNIFMHNMKQLKDCFRHLNVVDSKIVCSGETEQRRGFTLEKVASRADRNAAIARFNPCVLGMDHLPLARGK
jgi:hypothetical protein